MSKIIKTFPSTSVYFPENVTPEMIQKRLKKSKFANFISRLSDEQIRMLAYCLVFDQDLLTAINMYNHAVDNRIHIKALEEEFTRRQNKNKTMIEN